MHDMEHGQFKRCANQVKRLIEAHDPAVKIPVKLTKESGKRAFIVNRLNDLIGMSAFQLFNK